MTAEVTATGAASRSPEEALAAAVVRVKSPDGEPVGGGFLVAPDLVLTCAHVVSDALRRPREDDVTPGTELHVDLPFASGAGTAELEHWVPVRPDQTGDIAVLRLRAPILGAHPVHMADTERVWGHDVRVPGFPWRSPGGVWHYGRLRGATAEGWLQLSQADPHRLAQLRPRGGRGRGHAAAHRTRPLPAGRRRPDAQRPATGGGRRGTLEDRDRARPATAARPARRQRGTGQRRTRPRGTDRRLEAARGARTAGPQIPGLACGPAARRGARATAGGRAAGDGRAMAGATRSRADRHRAALHRPLRRQTCRPGRARQAPGPAEAGVHRRARRPDGARAGRLRALRLAQRRTRRPAAEGRVAAAGDAGRAARRRLGGDLGPLRGGGVPHGPGAGRPNRLDQAVPAAPARGARGVGRPRPGP